MCKGVAVMRRRDDSWLNATQILKVAGFDKPQRTRVLEREVQKGTHEKVQGGYGKYQGMCHANFSQWASSTFGIGTWIPLDRGLALAKQYNCEHLLRPIIEFQPAAKSPPLAPKHLASNTGSATKPSRRSGPGEQSAGGSLISTRSTRRNTQEIVDGDSDRDSMSGRGSEDGSMTPSPSEASSSSRTPSPINSPGHSHANLADDDAHTSDRRRRYRRSGEVRYEGISEDETKLNGTNEARTYGDQILEYFISDSNQIPSVLINPPSDFDPNMAIDDDGHTSLHWACAMGRIRIVKLLLTAGADIFKVNKAGQTALMRSVMFANNYDVRKFQELHELLHRSTLNIDNYNRTVFHHVVDVAMTKGKMHAARYYMEIILGRLAGYPKELADVINFQDEERETALTMAARCRSKRLVKLLIDHGADPKVVNGDGKSAEDYILEDEKFRSSPIPTSRATSMSFRNAQAAFPPSQPGPNFTFVPANGDRPPLHHSVAAQRASTRCINDMAKMLDSLAASFDQELRDKEKDMNQAQALLTNIQTEILESQRIVSQLKSQAENLTQTKQSLNNLEGELLLKMGRRYRLGWEKWIKDEEIREKQIRGVANGDLVVTEATAQYDIDGDVDDGESSVGEKAKGKRKATEDISDLVELHSNIPVDPEELSKACDHLREEIIEYRKRRKTMFDDFVAFQTEAGTTGRMGEYRRLIASGGSFRPSEVDQILGVLLEVGTYLRWPSFF